MKAEALDEPATMTNALQSEPAAPARELADALMLLARLRSKHPLYKTKKEGKLVSVEVSQEAVDAAGELL